MGLITNIGNIEKMQPRAKVAFDSLDFITDQLRNLLLQDPWTPVKEEDQPLAICMFLAGLEDTANEGPPAYVAYGLLG